MSHKHDVIVQIAVEIDRQTGAMIDARTHRQLRRRTLLREQLADLEPIPGTGQS